MSRRGRNHDQSTDSEEENSTRHDRFKSERFQGNSPVKPKERESNDRRSDDRYRSRSYRDRSPVRSYRHRESSRTHSSYRSEPKYERSNHDRKDKRHQSRPDTDRAESRREGKLEQPRNKTNLSSLLKKFDDNCESKRKEPTIGPSLPPEFKDKLERKEPISDDNGMAEDLCPGPVLPPHLRQTSVEKSNDSSKSDESDNSLDSSDDENQDQDVDSKQNQLSLEGPAVPPSTEDKVADSNLEEDLSDTFGPSLPPKLESTYGPALPPKVETDSYGPALPPSLNKSKICGPLLPKDGLPDELEESEDEDTVGPLPEGKMTVAQYQLNLRAMDIKRQLEDEKLGSSKDEKKREEWMLELPPEKASNLGLGPRSFRKREAPDMSDRSGWTDTPSDKLRKEQMAASGKPEPVSSEDMMKSAFIQERNEAMEEMAKRSRKEDRPKTLLEMHQKKLKKKKKKEEKEGKKKERRPFDRNIDLQVNRFDDAQKKAIFKKAQLLDTRFSSGASKFL